MALWSGRFERDVDEFTQRFGASLPIDRRMYRQDIAASIAHARMLGRQGIVSQEDAQDMVEGLSAIRESMDQGGFVWDVGDEDIHMAVERALTDRCRGGAPPHRSVAQRPGRDGHTALCQTGCGSTHGGELPPAPHHP